MEELSILGVTEVPMKEIVQAGLKVLVLCSFSNFNLTCSHFSSTRDKGPRSYLKKNTNWIAEFQKMNMDEDQSLVRQVAKD